jgi:murein DD-endopeptidase MepM/ murein hydrolase activator NlpD
MRDLRRATTWAIAITSAVAVLCSSVPAGAQSTGSRLSSARDKATRIKSAYERIGEEYARIEALRGRTAIQVSKTRSRIAQTKDELTDLRRKLRARVRAAYMMRGVGVFDFLMQARDFREFSLRFMVLQQQSLADEQTVLDLRKKTAQLESQQKELSAERRVLTDQSAELRRQGRQLSLTLDQANQLVSDLQGRLKAEQIQKLFRIASSVSPIRGDGTVYGMAACPVAGPHYVTNSYGDPRGGGTRSHQGNDIMSPKGTPVVAVVDGVVRQRTGGLGGLAYHLQGGNALFYYAHLNDFVAADGAQVKAGQLIGHNGNTGDAAGGPDHVHFEIHPGQGWTQAIDPYPSLVRVC